MYKTVRGRSTRVNETKLSWLLARLSFFRLSSPPSRLSALSALGVSRGFFLEVSFLFAEISRRYRAYISGMQFLSRTQEKRASVTSLRLSSAHWNAHARDSASPPMPHPERIG